MAGPPDLHALRHVAGVRSPSRGRRLPPDESGAKYVNSPESPLWQKGSTLYGLHLARTAIAKAEEAIVVEGYTDVIGLVQAGYENVVASMGTALTQQQLRELRKLARNVVLLFDADTAGSEAALRGLELATSPDIDLRVRVALPPRGSDPAEVAASGREAVDRMLGRAQSVLAFRVSLVLDAADTGSAARARARPTRRSRASCAARPRRPSATSSCASPASRLRLPSDAAARLAPGARAAPAGDRAEEPPARLRDGRRPARRTAAAGARARGRGCRIGYARPDPARGVHARRAARGARLGAGPTEPG